MGSPLNRSKFLLLKAVKKTNTNDKPAAKDNEPRPKADIAAVNKENKDTKRYLKDKMKANQDLIEKALKENKDSVAEVAENVSKIGP